MIVRIRHAALAVACGLVLGVSPVSAQETDLDTLIAQLTGETDAPERNEKELAQCYAQVLRYCLPDFGRDNLAERERTQNLLTRIALYASRPGHDVERSTLAKLYTNVASFPTSPRLARYWLLRQVEVVGRDECVPMLTKLLNDTDAQVREIARRALQVNPALEAGQSLRERLRSSKDSAERVALMQAVSARDEEAAIAELEPFLGEAPEVEFDAAIAALGDLSVAPRRVFQALEAVRKRRPELVASAMLRVAERCDDEATAVAIYSSVFKPYREHGLEKLDRESRGIFIAGLRGAMLGSPASFYDVMRPLVIGQLGTELAIAACQLASEAMLSGDSEKRTGFQRRMAADLSTATLPARVAMIETLGGGQADNVLEPLCKELGSSDTDVRLATIDALGRLGSIAASRALVQHAVATSGREAKAARRALATTHFRDVDAAFIAEVEQATDAKQRDEWLLLLAERRVRSATPVMLRLAMASTDAALRRSCWRALRRTADASIVPQLLEHVAGAEIARSDRALCELIAGLAPDSRAARELLAKQGNAAAPELRTALIGIIGNIQDSEALHLIQALCQSSDLAIVDNAIRALITWRDAAALEPLATIARTAAQPIHRTLALRASFRLLRESKDLAPNERLARFRAVADLATTPELQVAAVAVAAELDHPDAVTFARRFLKQEQTRDAAALAMLKVAHRLAAQHGDLAKSVIVELADFEGDAIATSRNELRALLDRSRSWLGAWSYAGPFQSGAKGAKLLAQALGPEVAKVEWRPFIVSGADDPWMLDFTALSKSPNQCVYVQTQVFVADATDVVFLIGSDDSVKVWVAGREVHVNPAQRPLEADSDRVPVHLPAGWSTVRAKVVQASGGWGFCCRVTMPDGAAVDGMQVRAQAGD